MTNGRKSTSTTLELKYILEKNFGHDALYALFCFFCTVFLQLFGNFWFIICITILCISLLAMVVNLIFAKAIEFGRGEKIRELCRTKAFSYFLTLHCLTRDRVRVVLKHIEMGEDLSMDMTESIYFKTSNELELMEIVANNVYIGIGYSFMWFILVAITRSDYFVEQFGVSCVIICARIFCCVLFSVAANGLIVVAIEFGHGDLTREWCRTKVVSYFLMLHYHTRGRARLVLPKIECERREALQRMEDKRIKGIGKGEDCSKMQPLLK